VITPSAGESDPDCTLTVSVIGAPAVAVFRTRSVSLSSNA
jgi:hypothetical protein